MNVFLRAAILFTVSMASLLVGCSMEPPGNPGVSNAAGETIEVFLVDFHPDGADELVLTLDPSDGEKISGTLVSECTKHELVARNLDGVEIERRPAGLCEDEVWIVKGDLTD
jgi:hypothetical protein